MRTKTTAITPAKKVSRHPVFTPRERSAPFIPSVQAKLEVGSPDSIYEAEADQMADQVVGVSAFHTTDTFVAPGIQTAPRTAGPGTDKDPDTLIADIMPPRPGEDSEVSSDKEPEKDPPEESPETQEPPVPDGKAEKPDKAEAGEKEEKAAAEGEEKEEELKQEDDSPEVSPEEAAAFQGEANMEPVAPIEISPELSNQFVQTKAQESLQSVEEEEEQERETEQEKVQAKFSATDDEENQEGTLQRNGSGNTEASAAVGRGISSSKSSGEPMPATTRVFMESQFQADFSEVKIHNDSSAAAMNNDLHSRAFTHENHIYFNEGQYNPNSREGQRLLAHELTHTVQQGAAVRRKPQISNTQPKVQRLGISDALDYFADKANNIPGYRMFTIILGVNPINMSSVDRSAGNVIRAMVEFLPGGKLITDALDNHGIFSRVSSWFKEQMDSLSITGASIKDAIDQFLDSLSWSDIFDLGGVWRRAKRIFTTPIKRLISFAKSLVKQMMDWVKEAILRPLALLAEGTPAYDLLRVVLGSDPITGDPYPPSAENLIGGFMKLIGQEEVWENIKKGNAIERAFSWFKGALSGLMTFVSSIPSTIIQTLKSLTWKDIVLVAGAFEKIGKAFLNIAGEFMSWAGGTVLQLLEIIFSVVAPAVVPWLKKAGGAFNSILENPIGFVGNLVEAAKQGFMQFAANIGTHLKKALINWLMGSLAGAGIYIPQSLSIKEIIKFVLSVLGISWANLRLKLVKHLGEPAVKALETGFELVTILVTKGPLAMWERIKEQLSDLKSMIIGEITSWVVTKVVTKAITKLVSSLNPAGAVIQAILFIYDTVTFLIDKIAQIARVGMAVLDSMAAIANGAIGGAVKKVEQTLAGMLTLAISFLANFLGLGKISKKIVSIVKKIQKKVDQAIDKVIGWIVGKAKAFLKKLITAGTPKDPKARLAKAMKTAVGAVNRLKGKGIQEKLITPILAGIKARYQLKSLVAKVKGKKWVIIGEVNPKDEQPTNKELSSSEERLLAVAEIILEATSTSKVLIPEQPKEKKVKLVASDVPLNKAVLASLIRRSSLSSQQKIDKIKETNKAIDDAGASESEAQIYYYLRKAQRIVNDIYAAEVASVPPNLEAHHIDRVGENPNTFEKTKKNRIRIKLKKKIKSLPQAEQDRMAAQSEADQKAILSLWVEQVYEQEVEDKGDELLDEISLVIATREIHRGKGDKSIHGAERAAKKKEEALYTPEHTLDDFNSGEYD
ncbi:eCIS core domain-containing protein [Poritiphilus flavus]|uniref:DUF4157 domain-containing protein n=1 Tax=Poritiphilus flavus TaxID=2697053 RepID=A0A6L9EI19_9FLAO|nr:DUF4157 domain-containing protein [Poritiphilus flavus]NAS14296.1 DUF4157 domain-containing protein [Poritiphilus flavus]